jgi:hypothetical protein
VPKITDSAKNSIPRAAIKGAAGEKNDRYRVFVHA